MFSTLATLGYYASLNEWQAYFLVFLSANLWGDLTAITGSILAYHDYLDWTPLIFWAFAGVFAGDNIVYQIGLRLRDTDWGKWIETHLPYHSKVEKFMDRNSFEALTLSKFIMGFNVPVLFMSGYCRIPFRTFIKSAFLAAVTWTAVIFPIGYLTATAVYGIGTFGYRKLEFGALLALAVVFGFRWLSRRLTTRTNGDGNAAH